MRKRGASGPYLKTALLLAGVYGTTAVLAVGAAIVGVTAVIVAGAALVGLVSGQDWGLWNVARATAVGAGAIALPLLAGGLVRQPRARAFDPPATPGYAGHDYRRVWASERRVQAAVGLAVVTTLILEFVRPSAALFVALVVGWSLAVAGTRAGVAVGFAAAAGAGWWAPSADSLSWIGWSVVLVLAPPAAAFVVWIAHGIGNVVSGRAPRLPAGRDTRLAFLTARVNRLGPRPTERYQLADALTNLAGVYASHDENEDAAEIFVLAVGAWSGVVSDDSPEMIHALRGQSIVHRRLARSRPPIERPAVGQTVPAMIEVSAEAAARGDGDAVYEHEAVHDRLLKTTPFGHVDFALRLLTDHTFPDGPVKDRAVVLRHRLMTASRTVQEGAATYVGMGRGHGDANDVRDDDAAAASHFEWLDERPGLEDFQRYEAAKILARRALQTALLEAWFDEDLWVIDNLGAYLERPDQRPDRRLDQVMAAARRQSDAAIARGVMEQLEDPVSLVWEIPRLRIPLHTVSPDPRDLLRFVRRVAERAMKPLPPEPSQEALRQLIAHPPAPYLGPSAPSLVVAPSTLERLPEVPPDEFPAICERSDLLMIAANPLPLAVPSRLEQTMKPRMLPSGMADLTAHRPGFAALTCVPIVEIEELLGRLPGDLTVCLYNLGYDYSAGDLFFTPCLGGRRHVVLVQSPWTEVAPLLGLRERGATSYRLLAAGLDSTESSLGFLVLRARRPDAPPIVMPTVRAAAAELISAVIEMSFVPIEPVDGLGELDFDVESARDLQRLMDWISGRYHTPVRAGREGP